MLNLTRLHLGIAHESQFQGLGITRFACPYIACSCHTSPMTAATLTPIEIGLTAAIVTMEGGEPAILVAGDGAKGETRAGLPFGPFDPLAHRTFEIGLRAWVGAQTGLEVGYVEQLYTFGVRGRHELARDTGAIAESMCVLASE